MLVVFVDCVDAANLDEIAFFFRSERKKNSEFG